MIIILVLALVFATSCKKDKPVEDTDLKDKKESAADDSKDVEDEEDEKTDNKKSAKAKVKKYLTYVEGGELDSVSSYVDDGGMEKLAEVENNYMDETACAGPTFICQNTSEIAPNAKITFRYRDDVLKLTPSISQKDVSLVLPDEVINAEGLLDWDSLIHEHGYSLDMYEIINSLIPKD